MDFEDSDAVLREDARIDSIIDSQFGEAKILARGVQQTAALSLAVSSCLESCMLGLEAIYVVREDAPISETAAAHANWAQEPEPKPCSMDAWLRWAMPEQAPPPHVAAASHPLASKAAGSRPTSAAIRNGRVSRAGSGSLPHTPQQQQKDQQLQAASRGSDTGGLSGANSLPGSRRSSAGGSKPGTAGAPSPTAQSRLSSAHDRSSRSGAGAQPAAAAAAPVPRKIAAATGGKARLTAEQAATEERLRQELALRHQQEALLREQKAKDDAARAAVATMQKDMKGKEYAYDRSGKVLLLSKVNTEALPSAAAPAARIAPPPAPTAPPPTKPAREARRTPISPLSAVGKAGKGPGKGGGSSGSKDFIEVPSRAQPSALETLKPSSGVVLRSGAAVKQGPRPTPAPGQFTRAQYQTAAKAAAQQERAKASMAAQQAQQAQQQAQQAQQQAAVERGWSSAGAATSTAHVRPSAASVSGFGADLAVAQQGAAGAADGEAAAGKADAPKQQGATVADFLASVPATVPPPSLLGTKRQQGSADEEQQQAGGQVDPVDMVNMALSKVRPAMLFQHCEHEPCNKTSHCNDESRMPPVEGIANVWYCRCL